MEHIITTEEQFVEDQLQDQLTEQEKAAAYSFGFDHPKRVTVFLNDILFHCNDQKWAIDGFMSLLDSIVNQPDLEKVKTFVAKIEVDLFDWTHNPTTEAKHKNRLTRRAIKANAAVIIPFSKNEIIARDGLNCSICGKLLTEKEAMIDHIVPLARGGYHRTENAQIACVNCNREKGEQIINPAEPNSGETEEIN